MSDTGYGRRSMWRDTAELDEARARERATRLEQRARSADEAGIRATYLDLLDPRPGQRVLEVGCGSGIVLRDLARRVAPGGLAVGLDSSPALLRVAAELAAAAGLAHLVELHQGDARCLPFPDGAFDVVLAATVLSHVPEAERAIREMVRVAAPGARVGVYDLDGDCVLLSHPDRALTRRIIAARSDQAMVDSWLARRLPGLFVQAGLEHVQVRAFIPFEREPGGFYASLAERSAAEAAQDGLISEEERRRWLDQLHAEQAAGRFLVGLTYLFVWGIVPPRPADRGRPTDD